MIPCEKTFGFTWKMTDEVKQEAADYYKSMFETACREAVKRCGEAEENGSKAPEENNFCETCDVTAGVGRGLRLRLSSGLFGAGGYSGFSGSQTSGAGGCDDGAETAGGSVLLAG